MLMVCEKLLSTSAFPSATPAKLVGIFKKSECTEIQIEGEKVNFFQSQSPFCNFTTAVSCDAFSIYV